MGSRRELIMRLDCEVQGCKNRAIARKFFVDGDGFWTSLCLTCFHKIIGWRS